MRIGIDARFLTHPQSGGFKTYTENLVKALSLIDDANTYVLYLDRPPAEGALPRKRNFVHRVVEGTHPVLGMPVREQIGLPRSIRQDRPDIMHFPCLTAPVSVPCPFAVTLHDVIWLSKPSFAKWSPKRLIMWTYTRYVSLLATRRARVIITVSESSKREIIQRLGVAQEKVVVTYEAVGSAFRFLADRSLLDRVCRQRGLPAGFVLAIGSADPRKNILGLLRAYAGFGPGLIDRYALVIVWTHRLLADEIAAEVARLALGNHVHFLSGVSDDELVGLYNAATVFAFPSHHEGFGLPLLEAMACGTPVVAAHNSSIPEVVGDAALLVDSTDTVALSTAIAQVLADPELRKGLGRKGLQRARMFSWERCARETLSIYEGIAR